MSAEDHRPFAVQGLVWVAEEAGRLIGFATCEAFEHELEAQGKGAGRALIAAVEEEARTRGLPAVTLTTFRDIPWNAPFYARCGFVELSDENLGPFLTLVREKEVEIGLDVANRCAMRLAL
jgi:GNAT superfamily N-acetyltransferase